MGGKIQLNCLVDFTQVRIGIFDLSLIKTFNCHLFGGYMQRRFSQLILLAGTKPCSTEIADKLRAGEEVPDVPGPSVGLGEGAGDGDGGARADGQVKQRLGGLRPRAQVPSLAHGGVGGALLLKNKQLSSSGISPRSTARSENKSNCCH